MRVVCLRCIGAEAWGGRGDAQDTHNLRSPARSPKLLNVNSHNSARCARGWNRTFFSHFGRILRPWKKVGKNSFGTFFQKKLGATFFQSFFQDFFPA